MGPESQLVRGLPGLHRLAGPLDELADRTAAPASMYTASVAAYLAPRPELEPAVLTLRDGNRLRGATVLAVRVARLGPQIVKGGVDGEPFRLMIASPADAPAMADALLQAFAALDRGWRAHLIDLPADDPTVDELVRRSPHARRHTTSVTPTLWVGVGSELNTVLSRNVRNARNKARNRIARDGRALDLRWTSDAERIVALLPEIVDLHIRRNQQLRDHAQLSDPAELDTFACVLTDHARAGRVRLLETRIDGYLAAFDACLVAGRRLWVYANLAHPDWLEFSPGTIANAEVVRAAHSDPRIDVLDWGATVQRYKVSGGAALVPSQELYAWRNRHKAALWRARNYQLYGARRSLPLDRRR